MISRFAIMVSMIAVATAIGYAARRSGKVREEIAGGLMTFVAAFGYPAVGFLSIWALELDPSAIWLPTVGAAHIVLMTVLCLQIGRWVARDAPERGLFALTASWGNTGFTMGGFVIYMLYGVEGLGLVSIYGLMWTPLVVLLVYPIARHYSEHVAPTPLWRLMLRCLFDWRSLGLPTSIIAIFLSVYDVPRPELIARYGVVDVLIYVILPVAYFSIGLRMRVGDVGRMKRAILSLAGARFILAPALGVALAAATLLTPWPLRGIGRNAVIIESCVPTAVTVVAVANMFHLRPREASVLFVANTLTFVILILPLVIWLFG